ncbi:MAG: TonB-dependent receptor [Bacteroidales bacterium]|nr:TonB-dependent receptor [Lentimicrobiaceae bacterium]MDD5695416.1 TonB-dependent receptor [Bacteroidales bacterium]
MKKSFVITVLLFAYSFNSSGQLSIRGRITDGESGAPLIGANIQVKNTYLGTISGMDGIFYLSELKPGNYEVEVSYIGFENLLREIPLTSNVELNLSMQRTSLLQEEVQIQSTRIAQGVAGTYENVSREMISQINLGKDIPFLMSSTPSLTTTSDAGNDIGYSGLRIRGTDITRINVTINGIPYNDPESHNVYWVDVPDLASSLDNVQIQRGVGTSSHGAATFGASINFKTQSIEPEPYARIETSYGSFNSMKNKIALGSGLINDQWTIDARLSRITSDGYIDRASSDLFSYYVAGAYFNERNILKLAVFSGDERTYQAWEGVPYDSLMTHRTYNPAGEYVDDDENIQYYDNQIDKYKQTQYQLLFTHEFGRYTILNAALFYVRGMGYYENYKTDQKLEDYGEGIFKPDTAISRTDLIRQKWLDNHFAGGTFSALYNPSRKFQLTGGGAYNHYRGDHYGYVIWARDVMVKDQQKPWYENTGEKSDFDIYIKGDYYISKSLRVFADLQYRQIHYQIEGIHDNLQEIDLKKDFHFVNPKFSVQYTISNQHSLYGFWGIAHREPNRRNYLDSDAGYQPLHEILFDYELGYRFRSESIELEVNAYLMDYDNQLVLTGEINNVGDPIMVNVPESYRTGLEAGLAVRILKNLTLDANLSLSRNKILDFTEYVDNWDTGSQDAHYLGLVDLSFSPALIANNRITYQPLKGLSLSFLSKYVSRQYIDNTESETRRLDPYFVNHLLIDYSFHTKWIDEIGINLMVNNIFNAKYETDAWVYRYVYEDQYLMMNGYFPQATLNLMAGVRFDL